MVVITLTNVKPITLGSIEVKDQYEAFDLYSQNPNYVIAFVNNKTVTILGSTAQKESKYEVLQKYGYIFTGREVIYMCDQP